MAAKEEEEEINNMQKRFMFGNFNAQRADRKLGAGSAAAAGEEADGALEAEFDEEEIDESALKDFEEGPDVPEADLE